MTTWDPMPASGGESASTAMTISTLPRRPADAGGSRPDQDHEGPGQPAPKRTRGRRRVSAHPARPGPAPRPRASSGCRCLPDVATPVTLSAIVAICSDSGLAPNRSRAQSGVGVAGLTNAATQGSLAASGPAGAPPTTSYSDLVAGLAGVTTARWSARSGPPPPGRTGRQPGVPGDVRIRVVRHARWGRAPHTDQHGATPGPTPRLSPRSGGQRTGVSRLRSSRRRWTASIAAPQPFHRPRSMDVQ